MSISENIAKYRKQRGYTQERLGELVGVTNQAVSKWESAVSLPDVTLLPKIAEALGITLEDLYGIAKEPPSADVTADDFPKAANDNVIAFFLKHAKVPLHTPVLEEPWSLVCLSDTEGGALITKNFSLLDCRFKSKEDGGIFSSLEILSAMKKLSNRNVTKVLSCMYKDSFDKKETHNQFYSIPSIANHCELSEEEALDAVESLCQLHLLETVNDHHNVEYAFLKFRAFLVLSVFKTTELLLRESFSYEILRDTSQINDYAFLP